MDLVADPHLEAAPQHHPPLLALMGDRLVAERRPHVVKADNRLDPFGLPGGRELKADPPRLDRRSLPLRVLLATEDNALPGANDPPILLCRLGEEIGQRRPERVRESLQGRDRRLDLSALDITDQRCRNTCPLGKFADAVLVLFSQLGEPPPNRRGLCAHSPSRLVAHRSPGLDLGPPSATLIKLSL